MLEVNGRLLEAVADETPPTPAAVIDARRHHEQWVQNLAEIGKRLAGLAIVPRSRVQ